MATIKIKNNEPRVHTVGTGYGSVAGGQGTKAVSFRLLPGVNEVDLDQWNKAKQLPVIKHYLNAGLFVEFGGSKPGLLGVSILDAIETVKHTLDRELLKTWKNAETRAGVLSALETQIDEVTFRADRDADTGEEEMDLKPGQNPHALDGAEIAAQVQGQTADEMVQPQAHEAKDSRSNAPVQPPEAVMKALRPLPTPSLRGAKKPKK